MNRPLAVFDLDGTITRHDTLVPFLALFLLRHPWRLPRMLLCVPAVLAYVAGRADRGALKGALIHGALGGLTPGAVRAAWQRFQPQLLRRGLFAEALQAISTHRAAGAYLVLLSASPDLYVTDLGRLLGFDRTLCTRVRWRPDGCLDGHLDGPNCRGEEKRRVLAQLQAELSPARTDAYGNSSADLPHLALATAGWYVNGPVGAPLAATIQRVRWHRRATGIPGQDLTGLR